MFDPKPNPAAPNLVDGINLSESMAQKPSAPASPQGGSFTPASPAGGPSAPQGQGMEDIFAETDQAARPVSLNQNAQQQSGVANTPVNPVLPEPLMQLPDDLEDESGGNKKFFWVGLAVLIVILAVGGYFAYAKFFADPAVNLPQFNINSLSPAEVNRQFQDDVINFGNNNANANDTVDNNQNQNSNDNQNVNDNLILPSPEDSADSNANSNQPEPAMDSDKDGLSDQEENNLGTNPMEPDSDNDGLSDREEVKVYLTDPLNPDSDGDGYLDGAEVNSGYNPKGAGTLLEANF
ncbi:MAG: hypothetical protein Q8P32_03605 [Candidatus Komeilibacteria bacterium]|nr:hypothetical protein [Candidatus Komeilibacteria bacterium]